MTAVLCGQAAAQTVTFSPDPARRFAAAVLLMPSARFSNAVDPSYTNAANPDPHVFYLMNYFTQEVWPDWYRRGLWPEPPANYELYNPLAPQVVTRPIVDRWDFMHGGPGNSGLVVGQPVTPDMACYWEAPLTRGNLDKLAQFDLLVISHHRLMALSDQDRRLLRTVVDAGATLLVDECYAGAASSLRSGWGTDLDGIVGANFAAGTRLPDTANPVGANAHDPADPAALDATTPGNVGAYFNAPAPTPTAAPESAFITDMQFGPAGGPAGVQDRLNPLVSFPYFVIDPTVILGAGVSRVALVGPEVHPVASDASGPYIAAGRYGAGRVILSAVDLTSAVNNMIPTGTTITDGSGVSDPNAGAVCGVPTPANLGLPFTQDALRVLFNALAWEDEWSGAGGDSRHSGEVGEPTADRLDLDFEMRAPGAGVLAAGVPVPGASPVIADGAVFCILPGSVGGGGAPVYLAAFDLDPTGDLDQDGNPDDGAQTADVRAAGFTLLTDQLPDPLTGIREVDLLWIMPLNAPSECTPVVVNVTTGGASSDIVIVGDDNGTLYAATALPEVARVVTLPATPIGVPYPGWGAGTIDLTGLYADCGPVVALTAARGVLYAVTAGTTTSEGAVFPIVADTGLPLDPNTPYLQAPAGHNILDNVSVAVVPDPHDRSAQDETLYVFSAERGTGDSLLRAYVTRTWDERLNTRAVSVPGGTDYAYLGRGYEWTGLGPVPGGFAHIDQTKPIEVRAHDVVLPVGDYDILFAGGGHGAVGSGTNAVGVYIPFTNVRPPYYPMTLPWPPQEVSIDYWTDLGDTPLKWVFAPGVGTGIPLGPAGGRPPVAAPVVSSSGRIILPLARHPILPTDGAVAVLRDLGYRDKALRDPAGAAVFGPVAFDGLHTTRGWGTDSIDHELALDRLTYIYRIPNAAVAVGSATGCMAAPAAAGDVAVQPFTAVWTGPGGQPDQYAGVVALELVDLMVPLESPEGQVFDVGSGSVTGVSGPPARLPQEMADVLDLSDPATWNPATWPWEIHVFDTYTMAEIPPVGLGAFPNWEPQPKRNAIRFFEPQAGRKVLIKWIDKTSSVSAAAGVANTYFVYHQYAQVPQMVRWQFPSLTIWSGGPIARPQFVDDGDGMAQAGEIVNPVPFPNIVAPLYVDWDMGLVSYEFRAFNPAGIPPIGCDWPSQFYGNEESPDPERLVTAFCAPTITGDKVIVPVNYQHQPNAVGSTQTEALLRFALDPRDGELDSNSDEPWPGATVPWPPSLGTTPLDPPWPTYRYLDHGDSTGVTWYWRDLFESAGFVPPHPPVNASYDLLSMVSQITTGPNAGGHQVAAGSGRLVSMGATFPGGGPAEQVCLRTYEAMDDVIVGDKNRLIAVDGEGNPAREAASSGMLEIADATIGLSVALPDKLAEVSSVRKLESAGLPTHVLVADGGGNRVLELGHDAGGDWVEWVCRNREHPSPDSRILSAFIDTQGYGADADPGLPLSLDRPTDAARLTPWITMAGLRLVRHDVTLIADSGNARVVGVESLYFPDGLGPDGLPGTPDDGQRDPVTGGELVFLSDPHQPVVKPAAGNEYLMLPLPGPPNLQEEQVQLVPAGKYEYTRVMPVTNPAMFAGTTNQVGFSGVVAVVSNYALSTAPVRDTADPGLAPDETPDPPDPTAPPSYDVPGPPGSWAHPYPRELGPGASVVKLGRADHLAGAAGSAPDGRIDWAFSTIFRWDPGSGELRPFRKLERIYDIDLRFTPDLTGQVPANPQAAYMITICAQTSRVNEPFSGVGGPGSIEEGVYPVTYLPAVGPETGEELMQSGAVQLEGYAILGLPPGATGGPLDLASGLSADQLSGNAWYYSGDQYAASMGVLHGVWPPTPSNPMLPYTGAAGGAPGMQLAPYALFKPVSVEAQMLYGLRQPIAVTGPASIEDDRSPVSYLVVNGHEAKSEVLELEPLPGGGTRLKRILPRPDRYGAMMDLSRRLLARDHADVWPPVLGSIIDQRSTDERQRKPWLGTPGIDGLTSTYRLMQPLSATARRVDPRPDVP